MNPTLDRRIPYNLDRACLVLAVLSLSILPAKGREALFREVPPRESGVRFEHPFEEDHPQAYLYHSGYAVGAICLGDVNGDQRLDLYLVNGPGANRLFLNNGGGSYLPQAAPNIDGDKTWGTGAALVDIDGDGDLDLYQCNYDAPNQLFLNDGRAGFTEVAGAGGLDVRDASMNASFADIDNDGDLDMFLLCDRVYDPMGRPARPPVEFVDGVPRVQDAFSRHLKLTPAPDGNFTIDEYGRRDYLFLNQGADDRGIPRFKDITEASGMIHEGHGLSSIWWDYDSDGDLDLFVANDFIDPDRLYRNDGIAEDGIPRFTDVIADQFPAVSWSSMGSDAADFNDDGLPDLFSVEMAATTHFKSKLNMGEMNGPTRSVLENGWPRQAMRNHLFVNTAAGFFQESAFASGLHSSDWSWSVKFGDLDNDGRQDVFIGNGISRNFTDSDHGAAIGDTNVAQLGQTLWDLSRHEPPMPEENLVFRNTDGKVFEKRPDWGLGLLGMTYSAAMGDLDNDGDLDLVVSDLGKNIKIFENQGTEGNGFRVKLRGDKSNRMGIGARVTVTDSSGAERTRWMNPWTGFQSQHDTTLHFGLGGATARRVSVVWPSGIHQELEIDPAAGEVSILEQATGSAPPSSAEGARFAAVGMPDFKHREQPFDDFKRQPLLPTKHSQEGPCLASGDVDGDGDVDLFVGGGNGQPGSLFLNQEGILVSVRQEVFEGPAEEADDTAAVWLDADGDGDLDLFVVTGGTEFEADAPGYRDHLYLNQSGNGEVRLSKAPEGALPRLADSGSCIAAADFDGDGDIDVFIGSRLIPGRYPMTPPSRLLRNDSAGGVVKFTEATPDVLKMCGMVTDAAWADFDGDGAPDLALGIDWGPVMIFRNTKDGFIEVSDTAGTGDEKGWWRSLHATDIDGDGDLDLIAGNAGINTKYRTPSAEKPVVIYYGDMDGSGIHHIVEAKYDSTEGELLPVRGRSCTSLAIPGVKKRFNSYRAFASADLDDIYGGHLSKAYKVTATRLESGVWINESTAADGMRFRWLELPWEAQLAPVNDVVSGDFNFDGAVELILAQNHYTNQAETGLWRGNPGCHLEWRNDRFAAISHRESGILLPNDTRSLTLMDTNGDGAIEVIAGQNNDRILRFENRGKPRRTSSTEGP